jgi:hypothetical protein
VRIFLETISGPYKGKVLHLESGDLCRVGSAGNGSVILADDGDLAPIHFALSCDSNTCNLFDWGSQTGTFLNGERIYTSTLSNGDRIEAGRTLFVVHVETGAFREPDCGAIPPRSPDTPLGRLLQILQNQAEPLYALLDAARDPLVLRLLTGCQEESQSLYDGVSAEELAEVAPYLVKIQPFGSLLPALVNQGWGNSFGVYFTSREPFARLRKHFRSLQFVENEYGESLYFRFYDPRVLRVYLPTCNSEETEEFMGPVSAFLLEDQTPLNLLVLGNTGLQSVSLTGNVETDHAKDSRRTN